MADKELKTREDFTKCGTRFLWCSLYYSISAKELLSADMGMAGPFPAVFCLRNAIELLQKAILYSLGENPNKYQHPLIGKNLKEIKSHLPKIDNLNKHELVRKFYIKLSKEVELKRPEESFHKNLEIQVKQIEALAAKYENYSFLGEEFKDPHNDKARFPESEEFYNRLNQITPAMKLELIKDSETISSMVVFVMMLDDNFLKSLAKDESEMRKAREFLDN